eukprot:scaffold981_cov119-Cylindrotheca_fusiformis.AAC.7
MYRLYLRRQALEEQEARRNHESTYREPLGDVPDLDEFVVQFSKSIVTQERRLFYREEQAKYPHVKKYFDMLVPAIVSYEDFWFHYDYRTDLDRIMRDLQEKKRNVQADAPPSAKSWSESMSRMRQSFRRLGPEEPVDEKAETIPKTVPISEGVPQAQENTNRVSLAASFGRMRGNFRKLVTNELSENAPEPSGIADATQVSIVDPEELGKLPPVDQGEDEERDENVVSSKGGIGKGGLPQESAFDAPSEEALQEDVNIHVYPDWLHDDTEMIDGHEDQVEQPEEDETLVEENQESEVEAGYDSASETESESDDQSSVADEDNQTVDSQKSKNQSFSIHVYPETINLANDEMENYSLHKDEETYHLEKVDVTTYDDEYGSTVGEKIFDDDEYEYGSLGSLEIRTPDLEVDEGILLNEDMYHDDNFGEKENCECVCLIM